MTTRLRSSEPSVSSAWWTPYARHWTVGLDRRPDGSVSYRSSVHLFEITGRIAASEASLASGIKPYVSVAGAGCSLFSPASAAASWNCF